MSPRVILGLTVVSILAACVHAQPAGPPNRPAELVPSTLALVEEVRGLKAKTPIEVQVLEPKKFAATLAAHVASDHADLERLRAVWVAFGLVPPSLDLSASINGVLDEQVVGFYDPKTKVLRVRSEMPPLAGVQSDLITRGILAHEIEHALQDQLLMPLDDSSSKRDDGESLARTALIEGDAQLTMLAALAKLQHQPLEQSLANMAALTHLGPDALAGISGFSAQLLRAPPVLKETLMFPYIAGLELAGALWHSGGFELVNRAFRSPPVSASQVLHPARYAKGLRPRPVPQPTLPEGWIELDRGSAGELGTLEILEPCLPRSRAEAQAARLAGDAYVVGERPDGKLALIWVSLWPSSQTADSLALDIVEEERCWNKIRGDGKGSVGSEVQIRVPAADSASPPQWFEIAVLRGIPGPEGKTVMAALEKVMPGPMPVPQPPFGEGFRLEPVKPAALEVRHGTLSGQLWSDDGLGLAATIPPGWEGKNTLPGIALLVASSWGAHDNGIYAYVPAALDPALGQQITGAFTASIEATLGGGKKLHPEGEERIAREGVSGVESRWSVSSSDMEVRVRLLPVCGGRGTAMLATLAHGSGAAALKGWVESFRIGKPGPNCP